MVVGVESNGLQGEGQVVEAVDPVFQLLVAQPLVELNGVAGTSGQPLGHSCGRRQHLVGRHHVVHQTEALGLGGVEQIAGHQQFLGPVEPHQQRPQHRSPVAGHQPGVHMGVADAGRIAQIDDVAEQGQRRAQPDGVAVDRGHHGLADPQRPPGDVDAVVEQVGTALGIAGFQILLHDREVGPHAERPACAGEHHRPHVGVLSDAAIQVPQVKVHLLVEAVAPIGPIQRGDEHPGGVEPGGDGFQSIPVCHGASFALGSPSGES